MNLKWSEINWRQVGATLWSGTQKTFAGIIFGLGYMFGVLRKAGNKVMGILGNLFGASVLAGALIGPGVYQMTQQNEIVRAKVTGRAQADAKSQYHGLQYFIYTDVAGKLDTASISYGRYLKENCVYDFNLKGARIQPWPLSYSRSIIGVTNVTCPSLDKK